MNTSQTQLAPVQEAQLATRHEPTIPEMMSAVIEKGITADSVSVMEKMLAMKERMDDRVAEREFAAAFVALQSDMPPIQAVKPVPNKDRSIRYKFAPYEEIMDKARPILQRHGFTVTFSMSFADGRITQNCTLQHIGGHKRTNQFMARIGQGPPGSSEAQGDGAAATYAKRQALCDALNIVVEHDTDGRQDARDEGAPINDDQAQTLRELVKETKSDEVAFLKFAGAATYSQIGSGRYQMLFNALQKKLSPK